MRVWHISPALLDSKRLVAQHREIHMFITCVRRGREWGPTRELKHSCQYASYIHDVIVKEMDFRKNRTNSTHPTTFEYLDLGQQFISKPFEPTIEHLKTDVIHLRQKWELEGYFYGVGREELAEQEKVLGLETGIRIEEAIHRKERTRALIKENKSWFEAYRLKNPKSRMQDRFQAFLQSRS